MLIGVISDTHDRLPTFEAGMNRLRELEVEAIFHAGDYVAPFAAKLIGAEAVVDTDVYAVYGNNDGEREGLANALPQIVDGTLTVELAGRTIVMDHFIDWIDPADREGADLVISGHTHEVVNTMEGSTRMLNPGECCGWLTGRCTVATVDLQTLDATIYEL